MITILLNGTPEYLDSGISVSRYLGDRSINPAHVVVEINKKIIDKEMFDQVDFREGDQIEILRFVGGG